MNAVFADFTLTNVHSVWLILAAGFGVGLMHAFEPDHLAAVSTLVCQRRSLWRSALIGGWWGVGHTLALLVAGVLVILLQFRISDALGDTLEFGVAVMLVCLGLNALMQVLTRKPQPIVNAAHPHAHGLQLGWRPLLIGIVHGMAGSAALLFLAVSQIQASSQKFLFLLVFGLGSIGGMMLMSVMLSLPAYWTAARFAHAHHTVRILAGGFSLCLGLWMVYEIGYVKGLLIPHS